jgi:hypothetical protein
MELISLSCWVTLALMIWFESDAFVQYSKAFGLSLAFCIVEYENHPLSDEVGYVDFLRFKYGDSFWINLITCPICLSVWLTAAISLASGLALVYFAVVNLLSLCFFFIIKRTY